MNMLALRNLRWNTNCYFKEKHAMWDRKRPPYLDYFYPGKFAANIR